MYMLPLLPVAFEMFKPGGAMVVGLLAGSCLLLLLQVLEVFPLVVERFKPRISIVVWSVGFSLQFFRLAVFEVLSLMVQVLEPGVSVIVHGWSSGFLGLLLMVLCDHVVHAFKPAISVSVHRH